MEQVEWTLELHLPGGRRVARAIGSARISIVLAPDTDGSSSEETGYVMVASDDETLTNLAIDLADYPEIREVLRCREPLTIEDVRTHPVLQGVTVGQDLGAMVLIPIVWETQAIGVFFLRLETPHRVLQAREMRYCQAVANATADRRQAAPRPAMQGQAPMRAAPGAVPMPDG